MKAIKAATMLTAMAMALGVQALTLNVKDVKMAQRYPWNGLVDIDYTIESDSPNADVYVYPVGYDADFNVSIAPRTLTGDGANGKPVKPGVHRMTWDMAADMGENYNRAKVSMKIHAYAGATPYLVVDLSAGPEAQKYEITYLNEIPGAAWPVEYKTTKLLLKLVVPGTFMMGSPNEELGHNYANGSSSFNDETRHQVTLTQPFYMGVFELTQQQYKLVMGSNPSYHAGDSRPVEAVSYNDIRGGTLGAAWPSHRQVDANSFMGKLRSRTGLTFDLPTEAQWEYTCRAGTDSALNNGKNLSAIDRDPAMAEVGRYYDNKGDNKGGYNRHTEVGSYRPNAWGFYDMHGNVHEWCLDWWAKMSVTPATDPKGAASGSYRVLRGGDYDDYAVYCRSACRYGNTGTRPTDIYGDRGFRVCCLPAD